MCCDAGVTQNVPTMPKLTLLTRLRASGFSNLRLLNYFRRIRLTDPAANASFLLNYLQPQQWQL